MKKIIVWDFDDTLIETKSLFLEQYYEENRHRGLSRKELKVEFEHLPIDEKIKVGRFLLKSGMINYAEPVENSKEIVEILSGKYIQKCLTARPTEHYNVVQNIIKKHFSSYINRIHCFGNFNSKVDYAYNNLEALILIDDNPLSFGGIENTNNYGVLYDNENKHSKIKNSKLIRITSLLEIEDIIENLK